MKGNIYDLILDEEKKDCLKNDYHKKNLRAHKVFVDEKNNTQLFVALFINDIESLYLDSEEREKFLFNDQTNFETKFVLGVCNDINLNKIKEMINKENKRKIFLNIFPMEENLFYIIMFFKGNDIKFGFYKKGLKSTLFESKNVISIIPVDLLDVFLNEKKNKMKVPTFIDDKYYIKKEIKPSSIYFEQYRDILNDIDLLFIYYDNIKIKSKQMLSTIIENDKELVEKIYKEIN